MAKLQIFVFVVALSQVYGSVEITNFPALLPLEPKELPTVPAIPAIPEIVSPPCVSSIRAILEAIIARLPGIEIEQPRPLPVDPINPEVPEIGMPEVPEVELETPCSACFEHINSLLTTAEQVIAVRRLADALKAR